MSVLADLSNDLAALVAEAGARVVSVRAGQRRWSGLIWQTGLVVTADEAIDGDDDVEVLFADGRSATTTVAGRDPATDVALLKLGTVETASWTASGPVRAGMLAVVVGGGDGSANAGLTSISEVGPAWRSLRGGEIDARVHLAQRLGSRNEGAAAVAPDGTLIGMAVSGPRRRALVIPASTIARAVATLSEKGYVPRGWLGVMLHPVGEGAIVLGIDAESPADAAGLMVGDVITTWNGEPIDSVGGLAGRLASASAQTQVKLGVLRGGNASDIDVILGERARG